MFYICYVRVQELSPTSDTSLVKGLINLIDCLTDEFHDEAKLLQFSERETCGWLEVNNHHLMSR